MPVYDLFSKRQRREHGEMPDVYQYDDIPKPLRVQLVHIFRDGIEESGSRDRALECFRLIKDALCREYGVFDLGEMTGRRSKNNIEEVYGFILEQPQAELVIDAVELALRLLDGPMRKHIPNLPPKMSRNEVIEEVNRRFHEHGVGFQYASGKMVRVDSQIIHKEVVKPVLQLLQDPGFTGANEEYLRAHEHYRHRRFPECLNDCLKSLESTLKSICEARHWTYKPNDTAKPLLNVVFEKGLVPSYLKTHFATLRQNLESGVPTIRNKLGGHGQGAKKVNVPQHFAAYQLHMTAAAIVFLVESVKAMP